MPTSLINQPLATYTHVKNKPYNKHASLHAHKQERVHIIKWLLNSLLAISQKFTLKRCSFFQIFYLSTVFFIFFFSPPKYKYVHKLSL